ncbi:hypothetical protein NLU13_5754 [Sarocladium strictum]|uniref:Uncharacterized protein n=1 Tax=Sarocladium strictum TaxID=5046 RepID=A0AA39GHI3_SARSR|nr:hypothetical protein NLU13_5754 [Sarocladium strictum]
MASAPFDPLYTGANLFDIYTDGFAGQISQPGLPEGGCNFVDLTLGANGAKCGCRRFWSRQVMASAGGQDQTGWCMCNHHACFHDPGEPRAQDPVANVVGQENERPRAGRAPLSPVMDVPSQVPPTFLPLNQQTYRNEASLSFLMNQALDVEHPMPQAIPQPPGSIPDTLAWGDLVQSPNGQNALPPIPSQCLMPSQTTSTTSSAQARYLRPFAGKGLQTLSGVTGAQPRSPLGGQHKPKEAMGPPPPLDIQSRDGSPLVASVTREGDTQQSLAALESARGATSGVSRQSFRNLSETVSGHAQRLDRLETISFSAGAHDECAEKHDNVDLRVTELEGKIEEVEKLINETGSVIGRRDRDDDANESVASVATSVASRALHSQELQSQLQALQAQVSQLQSALPTFAHPWEVEVVFLPFPLQSIWQGIHHFRNTTNNNDDWTQMPMTYSTTTLRSQSPFFGDWATPEHDDNWLLPKACGDSSIIDKRLRSRGLVRTVSVKGPDARSVQMAMNSVFGDVFREMGLATRPHSNNPRIARFYGLQSTWVPLRKIHKDSRLRFLSPPEMLSPAMWDVQFLTSVMMRSSEPRLFVTHPEAYIQDHCAFDNGWTWHKIRTMDRVYPDMTESQEVPEADALEDYWAFSEPLDNEASATPLPAPARQRVRMSSSPSQQYFPAKQSWSSASQMPRSSSPAVKSRRRSRPPHIRTTSMPVSGHDTRSPASARRRIASGGYSRRSTPSARTGSQSAVTKRRQARSPSHARFTPRWTASPSPGPLALQERQHARGTTPFAYATPHSNAPLQEMRSIRAGSAQPMDMDYYGGPHADEDGDFDIQIYESESEDADFDGSSESAEEEEMMTHAQPRRPESLVRQAHAMLPEDEPWPGIEDQELHGSDGENVDPSAIGDREDVASDVSSQPSEYPSTQRAWPEGGVEGGFLIHEDGDEA